MTSSNDSDGKNKLLIVDDDQNEMNSLAIGLRLEGFDADGVESGKSALEALQQKVYDAVLIDLMMPEMNGLQLARQIRNSSPKIITILMSAYHLSPVQLAKADTGVVGFVPKPFCFEDLVSFLRQKIDEKNSDMPAPADLRNKRELGAPLEIPVIIGEVDRESARNAS